MINVKVMQIKTINKTIEKKLTEWLNSITDTKLREEVKKNILVSGGSIASMLLNEKVNDYDVYIMDRDVLMRLVEYYASKYVGIQIMDGHKKEEYAKQLAADYDWLAKATRIPQEEIEDIEFIHTAYAISLRNLKEDQIKLFFSAKNGGKRVNEDMDEKALSYTPLYFSPNAISLSNEIQIVIRFWGTPDEIHQTFDFVHATNYFTFETGIVTNIKALESLLTRQLKYQGSFYPVTSIIRAKKFVKRGFNISAGELLKIMFQISELDLSNCDVLDEQLIGVDVAYFELLITALRNKETKDPSFKVSSEYFNTLIDKIFNETEED